MAWKQGIKIGLQQHLLILFGQRRMRNNMTALLVISRVASSLHSAGQSSGHLDGLWSILDALAW